MLSFLAEQMGTILVGLGVLLLLFLAGRSVYRQKKRGGCAGGCAGCIHTCEEREEQDGGSC